MLSEKELENISGNTGIEQLLYGHHPMRNIVGMDINGSGMAVLFLRRGDAVEMEAIRHRYFFMLSDRKSVV